MCTARSRFEPRLSLVACPCEPHGHMGHRTCVFSKRLQSRLLPSLGCHNFGRARHSCSGCHVIIQYLDLALQTLAKCLSVLVACRAWDSKRSVASILVIVNSKQHADLKQHGHLKQHAHSGQRRFYLVQSFREPAFHSVDLPQNLRLRTTDL